jgi:hypothetical protein
MGEQGMHLTGLAVWVGGWVCNECQQASMPCMHTLLLLLPL